MTEPTNQKIWELYEKHGTVEKVADILGVPRHEVSPIIDEMPLRQVFRRKGSASVLYTDDQLLDILRKAAKVCGEPLTLPNYHAKAPSEGWPAALTVTSRFGTWEEACKLAGVKVNKATGPRKGSITVEKCLVALRLCRADFTQEAATHNARVEILKTMDPDKLDAEERSILTLGEVAEDVEPSYERYVKWARANKQPSGPTVRAKVTEYLREIGEKPEGAWGAALQLAYTD